MFATTRELLRALQIGGRGPASIPCSTHRSIAASATGLRSVTGARDYSRRPGSGAVDPSVWGNEGFSPAAGGLDSGCHTRHLGQ